jgi:hypothetical protein
MYDVLQSLLRACGDLKVLDKDMQKTYDHFFLYSGIMFTGFTSGHACIA